MFWSHLPKCGVVGSMRQASEYCAMTERSDRYDYVLLLSREVFGLLGLHLPLFVACRVLLNPALTGLRYFVPDVKDSTLVRSLFPIDAFVRLSRLDCLALGQRKH